VFNGASGHAKAVGHPHEPIRLLFQGRFAVDRGLADIVRCIPGLRGFAEQTLQGFGEMEPELQRLRVDLGVGDIVHMVPPVPPAEVYSSALKCDVGVIPYKPLSRNLYLSTPVKLFDYLGAGLAIVSSDLPAIRKIVNRWGCGILVDPDDPADLAEAIGRLATSPTLLQQMKRAALSAGAEYGWEKQSRSLVTLVETVARTAPAIGRSSST
jgi:glycosyltransferase involved in cell wall biosynthesis